VKLDGETLEINSFSLKNFYVFFTLWVSIFHIIVLLKSFEATSSSCVLSPHTKMKYIRLIAYFLMGFGIT